MTLNIPNQNKLIKEAREYLYYNQFHLYPRNKLIDGYKEINIHLLKLILVQDPYTLRGLGKLKWKKQIVILEHVTTNCYHMLPQIFISCYHVLPQNY